MPLNGAVWCLAAEAIDAAGKQVILAYLDDVIPAVRESLCDPSADVREGGCERVRCAASCRGSARH